ncbi:Protein HOS4 [Stylophora pistillata]|uniref:Protein HOS4 n=2 Tax=Stylophora pistillata TaxID=50429 RepID=A0A2B4RYX8_STYPI|nr:Protein HOS4 [Stylophora pistillata]
MFVYQLKSRVELKAGIPANIFTLFFMNVQLRDQDALKTYHLKRGCIVRVKLEQNYLGLFEACWRGDIYDVFENGVQFLDEDKFQGYDISLWNKLVIQRATFALFIACHRGYLGLILELINRGATDINGKTVFGRSALHVAAYQGFVGCVSLLLSEGAICNQIDIEGKTPLALASENGHVYCERRIWLYQWNLHTFRPQSTRSLTRESSETMENLGRNGKFSVHSTRLQLSGKTSDQLDENNNNEQALSPSLTLPHVIINEDKPNINEDKPNIRRTQSHEQRRSNPLHFPLMHIAEKYRKELRDLKEGGQLPAHAQKESKEQEKKETPEPETLELENISNDEVEIVREANNKDELETAVNGGLRTTEGTVSSTNEKQDDPKGDDRDTPAETRPRDFERPPSGRSDGIRKLDILISESREKSTTRGQHVSGSEEHHETEHENNILREYSIRKSARTFDDWLQMKRSQEKKRPDTAPAQKSRLGKSIDPESFKRWLNGKRSQRFHTNSESSTSNKKTFISSSGLTFDRWLETKLEKRPMSAMTYGTESRDQSASGEGNKVRKQITSGKSYEIWLAEKKASANITKDSENNCERDKNTSKGSGKSFEVWLQDKQKQKQIELVQRVTTEKERKRLEEIDQLAKWLNPHYKTYEDWLAIKNHQAVLERQRAQQEPQREHGDVSSEEKQKDAKIVFNIWQTMKALKELDEEERKYSEMKAKWATKKKDEAPLRRLNIFSKGTRCKLKSTSEKI